MLAPVPGPSLPPRVEGDLIGTLSIHLQECSVDAFARIQFWGEPTVSDLHLHTNRAPDEPPRVEADRSAVVEYLLVGSLLALQKYLKDASPLQVQFLRQSEALDAGDGAACSQPELVGSATIADLCIAPLLRPEHADAPKTCKLSLQRRLQITRPNVDGADGAHACVGEALISLNFRLVPTTVAAPQMQDDPVKQGASSQQSRPQFQMAGPQTNAPSHPHTSMPHPSCINGITAANPSVAGDSSGLHSGLHTHGSGDQQNLLDELLDLCADDMTMPTLDSADQSSCFGTEMWISRIVANASSPPAKEFPSLVSAGSRRSSDLRAIGKLKLEIEALSLLARVANRLNGLNDFSLQYHPPPHAFETSIATSGLPLDPVEVTICERFGPQSKRAGARGPSPRATKAKDARRERPEDGKGREISLLSSAYSKELQVEFKDDEAVRDWLDGTLELSLFCRASTPVEDPNLPRVAKLAGQKRESSKATNPERVCVGRATFKLREALLSDTFTSSARLDLLSSADGSELFVGTALKCGKKIGSISVRLGLHPGDKGNDQGSPCSAAQSDAVPETDGKTPILMSGVQSASASTPHPISVFLSNYVGASYGNASAVAPGEKAMSALAGPPQMRATDQPPRPSVPSTAQKEDASAPLQPVKAPPIWLDIRVDRLSDLCIDASSGDSGCIQLCLSCSQPILSLDSLAHLRGDGLDRSLSAGSQIRSDELIQLRPDHNGPVSSSTASSWQVALEAGEEGCVKATVTIHLWHCASSSETSADATNRTLVGLVEVPFLFDPASASHCNWLPRVAANGWYNVVHPNSTTRVVGKVWMVLAAGMLRQIRGFSAICKRALRIQGWWRRARLRRNGKRDTLEEVEKEELAGPGAACPASKQPPKTELVSQEKDGADFDPEFDTIHARFAEPRQGISKRRREDPSSSPDSLFEEWSQQSLPVTRVEFSHRRQSKGKREAEAPMPAAAPDEAQVESESIISSIDDGKEESPADKETAMLAEEAQGLDCQLSTDQTECTTVDRTDILVRLETICGLQEILSAWLLNKHASLDKEALLSVSGVFVTLSIGQNDAAPLSEEEELRRLCDGTNVWHSNLISAESIALDRDVELNLESTLAMPDHEANTKRILCQVLEIKIWHVPLVTTAIAAMINGNEAKSRKTLDGCAVMAIAQCPLYPLYTPRGRYRGSVACTMAHGNKANVGSITACVCRVGVSESPLGSPPSADAANVHNAAHHDAAMSNLKPTNLEDSFSVQRQAIDPPEEVKRQRYEAPRSKRKLEEGVSSANPLDTSLEQKRRKKGRVASNTGQNLPGTSAPKNSDVQMQDVDDGIESDTLCPSDGSFDCDPYPPENDADDDSVAHRSLTSVMASLVHINSKLQRSDSMEEGEAKPAASLGGAESTSEKQPKRDDSSPAKQDLPRPTSKPEACTCHPMEPPEERTSPQTPATKQSAVGAVGTCEKGSSPLSMSHLYADAGTSTVDQGGEETNKENLSSHQQEEATEEQGEDSDSGGPEVNDAKARACSSSDRLQRRLDQSARKRHSGALFRYTAPSIRYGSLRGSILRGNRLLSPPLNSLSPSGGANVARSPSKSAEKNQEPPAQDFDRLERIFKSR